MANSFDLSSISLDSEAPPPDSEGLRVSHSAPGNAMSTRRTKHILLSNQAAFQERNPKDLVAVLHKIIQKQIPQIKLDSATGITDLGSTWTKSEEWNRKKALFARENISYSLGFGHSCFVELHEMDGDEKFGNVRLKKGDRVALKRYFATAIESDQDDDLFSQHPVYDYLQRELDVFAHLELRGHPNICRLLFVGWENNTPVPVLGLEVAEYGTLKDLLWDDIDQGDSNLPVHLTMDIMMGLEKLHSIGIVHGDIKPNNILVYAHPERRVTAKLADFAESIMTKEIKEPGGWLPVGGTHAWRAPECYNSTHYDLFKTDIYSFGLCALSVLANGPPERGERGYCFLTSEHLRDNPLNSKDVDQSSLLEHLNLIKADPGNIVLANANTWIAQYLARTKNVKVGLMAGIVVGLTLNVVPALRQNAKDTLLMMSMSFDKFWDSANTALRPDAVDQLADMHSAVEILSQGRQPWHTIEDELHMIKIHPSSDPRRSMIVYPEWILPALERIASPALAFDFAEYSPPENTADWIQPLEVVFATNMMSPSNAKQRLRKPTTHNGMSEKESLRAIFAAEQVARCYLWSLNRTVTALTSWGRSMEYMQQAIKWIGVAAQAGSLEYMTYYSILMNEIEGLPVHYSETWCKFWLLAAAAGGSPRARKILLEKFPDLVPLANEVHASRRGYFLPQRIMKADTDPETRLCEMIESIAGGEYPIDNYFESPAFPKSFTEADFRAWVKTNQTMGGLFENIDLDDSRSPLLQAQELHDDSSGALLSLMRLSLQNKSNQPANFKYTVLHLAASLGRDDLVDILLDSGANPSLYDSREISPIGVAAYCGHTSVVRRLIEASGYEVSNSQPRYLELTPLHWLSFVLDEDIEMLAGQFVANHGAQVLQQMSPATRDLIWDRHPHVWGGSPITCAALNRNMGLFRALLHMHLQFSVKVPDYWSLLERAVLHRLPSVVADLLIHATEIRPNAKALTLEELNKLLGLAAVDPLSHAELVPPYLYYHGMTPQPHVETFETLLKFGADPANTVVLSRIMLTDNLRAFKRLIELKISTAESSYTDQALPGIASGKITIGGMAIQAQSFEIFKYLADSCLEDFSHVTQENWPISGLHICAMTRRQAGDPRYIDILLQKLGHDASRKALRESCLHIDLGNTPLFMALVWGNFKVAQRLLESDACDRASIFTERDNIGFTIFGRILREAFSPFFKGPHVTMETIRFIDSVGGIDWHCYPRAKLTIFHQIAMLHPAQRPDHRDFRRALLEFLLQRAPPGLIDEPNIKGYTALGLMIAKANYEGVSILLRSGCSVTARCGSGSDHTLLALPFALSCRANAAVPTQFKAGGEREANTWWRNLGDIILLLRDHLEEEGTHLGYTDGIKRLLPPGADISVFDKTCGRDTLKAPGVEALGTVEWPKRLR